MVSPPSSSASTLRFQGGKTAWVPSPHRHPEWNIPDASNSSTVEQGKQVKNSLTPTGGIAHARNW